MRIYFRRCDRVRTVGFDLLISYACFRGNTCLSAPYFCANNPITGDLCAKAAAGAMILAAVFASARRTKGEFLCH